MTFGPRWKAVAWAAAAATFVAALGASMTDLGPWYAALKQPPWKPPDWAFGPVWTLIFALAAAAGVEGWYRATSVAQRQRMLLLFCANGLLNVLWSLLYFRLRRPDWALLEVPLLWLSVLALVLFFRRFSPRSALYMLPYLAWVATAAVLNYQTAQLNAPFTSR